MASVHTIVGRLTRDVELKTSGSGGKYVGFSVAENESVKQGDEWKDVTHFHDVYCPLPSKAEFIGKHGKKGRSVTVTGRVRIGSYEKDGVTHKTFTTVITNNDGFEFNDKHPENSSK